MVQGNIGALLVPVLLGNHQIHIADGLQELFPLLIGEIADLILLFQVEFIGGKGDNQIVPQRFGPAEQVDVTVMQQVKGSVT